MKHQRTLIVLAVALLTAAVASYAVYKAIERIPAPVAEVPTVPVVVASRDLAVGTELTREHLRVQAWPERSLMLGTYARPDELLGRGIVETIIENEPVTSRKVAGPGSGAGLPPAIPPGMRAISVRVNEVIGVAGYVVRGTRVDVLVSLDDPSTGNGRREALARTFLSNIMVLESGTRSEQQSGREAVRSTVVTLAVSPEDGERLVLASNEGRISLVLRNPLDVEPTETRGARLSTLLRERTPEPPPAPAPRPVVRRATPVETLAPPPPPPPPVHMVETIRAAKRSEDVIKEVIE